MTQKILIPDVGTDEAVEVIDVLVKPGDSIAIDDSLVTLESDKATMDVPATLAGVVKKVLIKEGDKVTEGAEIVEVESAESSASASEKSVSQDAPVQSSDDKSAQSQGASSAPQDVFVPDIGEDGEVPVIEIAVKVGDSVNAEDALMTLESDKATMDVPAPFAGTITAIHINEGDNVKTGSLIVSMASSGSTDSPKASSGADQASSKSASMAASQSASTAVAKQASSASGAGNTSPVISSGEVHAGPAVRKLAIELGVNLSQVGGTGRKGRITKEDLTKFVKQQLSSGASTGGSGIPAMPVVDFAKFGEIDYLPLSRINKLTGDAMQRNWLNVPHVTQFDDADITELEAFRKQQKAAAEKQGFKLTPLVFIMKAVAHALSQFPRFNSSLDPNGQQLIMKKYIHIGIAVDTPNGLVVPVVRDVDQKSIYDLSKELGQISVKAREGKLKPADMQGGCFTISSLGGIGGTSFTPIVNAPEVAILGVSKSSHKPVFDGSQFVPRLMLPLALSYDHRVIDGAEGARFMTFLSSCLADIRKILL